MVFAKRLRDGVRRGEITCSVRIWMRPHVKVGNRYRMEEGEIEVDSIKPIGLPDITGELARESGFLGVVDLLKVAKHGKGENIYLVRFHYLPPRVRRVPVKHAWNRLSGPRAISHGRLWYGQHRCDAVRVSYVEEHTFRHHPAHLLWRQVDHEKRLLPLDLVRVGAV